MTHAPRSEPPTDPVERLRAQSEAAHIRTDLRVLKHGSRYRIVDVQELTVAHVPIEHMNAAYERAQFLAASANRVRRLLSEEGVKAMARAHYVARFSDREASAAFWDNHLPNKEPWLASMRAAVAALIGGQDE